MHHTKYPFWVRLSVFILFLCIVTSSARARTKTLHYRLHPIWTRQFMPKVVDLNHDGTDELVIRHKKQIDVQDWKLRYYYHSFKIDLNAPYDIQAIPGASIDSVTFLVTFQKADTIFIKFFPQPPSLTVKAFRQAY